MKKDKKPLVSVIMPVYNAEAFIKEAIKSILHQTYREFEFIIIDDHSSDNSLAIIKSFSKKDRRIRIYKNSRHVGIAKTLNKAIKRVRGGYIARMDADDISLPDRLKKQLNYLIEHSNVAAVGSQCRLINNRGKIIGKKNFPISHEDIYRYAFLFNPVQHPTIMIAKDRLPQDFHYYDLGFEGAEDLNLIFKLLDLAKVNNLEEYLLYYRLHNKNSSLNHIKQVFLSALRSRLNAILNYHYQPSISSFIISLLQALLVLIIPEKIIYHLYTKIRLPNKSLPSIL